MVRTFNARGVCNDLYDDATKIKGSPWKLSVEAKVVKEGRETPVRLVYVPNRNKKREYLVLATTDMSLTEAEIIRNYGKRWQIEVFFKICKTYLKLSKESRSLSYDAMPWISNFSMSGRHTFG